MTELKPCPFCGSESMRIVIKKLSTLWLMDCKKSKYKYYAMCNKCYSKGRPIKTEFIKHNSTSSIGTEKAIANWNTRMEANNDSDK